MQRGASGTAESLLGGTLPSWVACVLGFLRSGRSLSRRSRPAASEMLISRDVRVRVSRGGYASVERVSVPGATAGWTVPRSTRHAMAGATPGSMRILMRGLATPRCSTRPCPMVLETPRPMPAPPIAVRWTVRRRSDTGTDAGPSGSACDDALSGVLFCDGFEAPTLFPWQVANVAGAEVARETDPVYRGDGSLGIELTTPGSRNSNVSTTFPSPVTSGQLFARAYVRIPSGASFDFLQFLSLTESQDPFGAVHVRLVSGPSLQVSARVNDTVSTTRNSSAILPTDQWLCFQVSVDVSPAAGSVSVFVDGSPLVVMTSLPTVPAGGYDSFVLGVNFSDPAQPPVQIFVDEAAVDTTASIPCDP